MTNDAKPEHITAEESRALAVRKVTRLLGVIAAAVLPSVIAFVGAGETARGKAEEVQATAKAETAVVKDKAESGYQFTAAAVLELQQAVGKLRLEVTEIKRRARMSASKRKAEAQAALRVAPPPVVPAPSAPLPSNLDKALVQQQALAPK